MAIIELESPFKELWRKGYLRQAKDGRRRVDLVNSKYNRTTISYARYLMCVRVGHLLPRGVDVDHIDTNCSNDSLDNLQVLSKQDHLIKTAQEATTGRPMKKLVCPYCNASFEREVSKVAKKDIVFCSRHCNAKYYAKVGVIKIGSEITEDQKSEIRRLNLEGLSGYKISKLLSISRNTVYKYIR